MDKIEHLRRLLYAALDNDERDLALEISRKLDILIIEKMYESNEQLKEKVAV